ncbi:MAG TPA: ArsA family ATPase [Acidimicrobiia bacterium]|nr:ArsA family ATPase [Acidimicrobiia bacterium]
MAVASTPDLLGRRLLFFTGKGGVGKSTVSAAMALLAAQQGRRVLLVSADGRGDIAAFFERRPVGFRPEMVFPALSAMAMDTEASLQEYLRLNLKVPIPGRIGPLAKVFDFVATAAPGVKEILTIGKICWEVRESLEGRASWDLVVVDAAATGHIVAQLGAPGAIDELVAVGPIKAQTGWMGDLLSDPAVTALNVVTTPEEMPVHETIELVERVRETLPIDIGAVVVNRVLPELFTHSEEAVFDALRRPAAVTALAGVVGAGVGDVLVAAELAVTLRRTRAAHLTRLRSAVESPLLYLPELFVRAQGMRVTRMVADALGEELGL